MPRFRQQLTKEQAAYIAKTKVPSLSEIRNLRQQERIIKKLQKVREKQDRPLRERVKQRVREQVVKENKEYQTVKSKTESKFNKGPVSNRRRMVRRASKTAQQIMERKKVSSRPMELRSDKANRIAAERHYYKEFPTRADKQVVRNIDVDRIVRKIKKARIRSGLAKKAASASEVVKRASRIGETAGRIAEGVGRVLPGLSIYFTVKDAMKYAHNKQMRKRGIFLTPEI